MSKKLWGITVSFMVVMAMFALTGCNNGNEEKEPAENTGSDTVVVTDMAGREVEVPAAIDSVFATGAIGSVFMYTLAPDLMTAWNEEPRDNELQYIKEEYAALPALGTWKGTSFSGNLEDLMAASPDVIISMGDTSEKYKSEADEIQQLCNIPVIMVSGYIEDYPATYEFMGKLLGREERASELGNYCNKVLTEMTAFQETLSDEEKVSLYYGEGVDGLDTEAVGSINAEAIELAGAHNVAEAMENTTRFSVSVEQVAAWDPDVIIVSSDGDSQHNIYNYITTQKAWAALSAIEKERVYEVPATPWDWINRPPSVARMIGVKWLANLLYPENYDIDIREEATAFFALFYDYELTAEELDAMLALAE